MPAPTPSTICIVSGEFNRLFRNGGIGTACTGLAQLFASAGHRVTVLYTGELAARDAGSFARHADFYAREMGIEVVALRPSPMLGSAPARFAAQSLSVYHQLRDQDWDAVFFNDVSAEGYATVMAKRAGLGFSRTALCVVTHGPRTWVRDLNQWPLTCGDDLEDVFMERETARFADHVVSPSQYMLDWLAGDGWTLPSSTRVAKVRLPRWPHTSDPAPMPARAPVRELVFFGRLETRKGVALFCDAIDVLARDAAALPPDLRITFLGKLGDVLGEHAGSHVLRRARAWPFALRFLPRLDQPQALEYLRARPATLAVIPSLVDNLPCVVNECLQEGLAFVATDTGGIPELVAASDRARCLFAPEPNALAATVRPFFEQAPPAWRPAETPRAVDAHWLATLDDVLADRSPHASDANDEADEADADAYALLVADGTTPTDDAIARLRAAARATCADVITCFEYDDDAQTVSRLGVGNAREAGYCRNVFGGPIALVRDPSALDAQTFVVHPWAAYCEASFAGREIFCLPVPLCRPAPRERTDGPGDVHTRVREVFERNQHRGCRHLFDLLVGHVAPADRQAYHRALADAEHGAILSELCRVPAQSDQALALMAAYATRTGRLETARELEAVIQAEAEHPGTGSVLPLPPRGASTPGARHVAWTVSLTLAEMREVTLEPACAGIQDAHAFALVRTEEQTPAVQVHPVLDHAVSGTLALGSAEGLREVRCEVFLANPQAPPVEFRLAVARVTDDETADATVAASEWTRVDEPGPRTALHVRLPPLARGDHELVLSTRLPGDRMSYAHARFCDLRLIFDGARLPHPDADEGSPPE